MRLVAEYEKNQSDIARKGGVIPDKPRSGAVPESIAERGSLRWIPALRFAPAGMTVVAALASFALVGSSAAALEPYLVSGDAIPAPLGGLAGDASRGRALVLDRTRGNCLICHQAPEPDEPFQGTIGPPLAGVGARLDRGQLRLRLVDAGKLNPATVMPPYFRTEGLRDVALQYRDRPALAAQEVEDVVAYLATLK